MDKTTVDEIISNYMGKIFGFALTHMSNTHQAEELAARITCQVYESLLKSQNVHNINGYVYRISQNVYARFIHELKHGQRYTPLENMQLFTPHDFTTDIEREETHTRLRQEISYMAGIQREILVLHYFERLKQYEIAERLSIPIGTVKWHLHDARKQLKESITMRKTENLALKPVKFGSIGHDGNPGNNPPENFLSKRIAQNIVYAAYHEARTITEIAELIGTPAAFVEDEMAYLEDNGFMEKLPGGKYLTTVYIHEGETPEIANELHELLMQHAKILCEKYVPLVINAVKAFPANKIYSPKGDINFLMWSAITYACGTKLWLNNNDSSYYNSRLLVKRPDGGEYITHVHVDDTFDWKKLNHELNKYNACGNMHRGSEKYNVFAWQLDTTYDSRTGYWQDNHNSDYEYLYEYITGKLTKDVAHLDKFTRLLEKGYLIPEGQTEYVNMAVAALSADEYANLLPEASNELKTISEELDSKFFDIKKQLYPAHMQELIRMNNSNILGQNGIRTRVLELLLTEGTLQPLTDEQKRSVNTILFCDTLPK